MPWKETTPMSQRSEFVQRACLPGRNLSQLCREYGISRKTGYKWLRRYERDGPAGLQDRSRRPHHSPRRTPQAKEAFVLKLRTQHPAWGGRKLHTHLKDLGHRDIPQPSTITTILQRHARISEEASNKRKAYQRFEKEAPNQLLQMDFKGPFAIGEENCYPLTVLDDHSRYLLGLVACRDQLRQTVQQALVDIFRQYGLPEAILVDNGPPWGPSDGRQYYTRLVVWLMRLGIKVIHSRPYHPQTLGKDERLHRSLKEEVLAWHTFSSFAECQAHFENWQQVYNTQRPHEALGLQPPVARYRPSQRLFPDRFPEVEYPNGATVRKVQQGGRINFRGARYRVGRAFEGLSVSLVASTTQHDTHDVYFCTQRIRTISASRVEC